MTFFNFNSKFSFLKLILLVKYCLNDTKMVNIFEPFELVTVYFNIDSFKS